MVVVGNEALQDGYCDAPSLAAFVQSARAALCGAGLPSSVPFTTAEPVASWGAHTADLCPVVDVVGVNIETFFDGGVRRRQRRRLRAEDVRAGRQLLPRQGLLQPRVRLAQLRRQQRRERGQPGSPGGGHADIAAKAGDKTVMFSYQNDAWKPAGVDQFFGCFHVF